MVFWERKTGLLRIVDYMATARFLAWYGLVVVTVAVWWLVAIYRSLCVQELALHQNIIEMKRQEASEAYVPAPGRLSSLQHCSAFSHVDFLALVRRHGCIITTQRCKKPAMIAGFLWSDATVVMRCSYEQLCAVCRELETFPQVALQELVVDNPQEGFLSVRIGVRIFLQ